MRHTAEIKRLSQSVLAVPPLAIASDGDLDLRANAEIIGHLESAGVSTLVYGGNALAHHWAVSKYQDWIDRLANLVAPTSWFIPSVGADAGKVMDQAHALQSRDHPVALLLPVIPPMSTDGLAELMRAFHRVSGVSLLVYIKTDNFIPASALAQLVSEGVVFGVKYAVPRRRGENDPYLDAIVLAIGADRVISGFGERPAVPHLLDAGLAGYTSGSVCIAPALSSALLLALKDGDRERAGELLELFLPLERLREEIHEIWVLHDAVELCGVARTGKALMPGTSVCGSRRRDVEIAARDLLEAEKAFRMAELA